MELHHRRRHSTYNRRIISARALSHATKAVDAVRRAEAKQRPELKGTRYVWLKRPEQLTVKQAAALEELRPASVGLATARAYRWRLGFDAFFEQPRELAETTWSAGMRARSAAAWSRSRRSPA